MGSSWDLEAEAKVEGSIRVEKDRKKEDWGGWLWSLAWKRERWLDHVAVLGSHSCCDKWLQTCWLKAMEIYSFTVLEARNVKSVAETKMLARLLSFWDCEGESVPCLFQPLVAAGMPWLVATSLRSPRLESSNSSLLCSHHCLLSVSDLPLASYKDICDCI